MERFIPAWSRHVLLGVAGFLLLLFLFQWDVMHELDSRLATQLQAGKVAFSQEIVLVDVPRDSGIPEFRARLGSMLQGIAAQPANLPRVVGLDIWFDADTPGHEPVLAGIRALQAQKVPVVGAVNIYRENSDGFEADYDKRHIIVLYGQMDGVGHNAINKPHGTGAWAFYVPCPKEPWPMAMAVWLAGRQALCERRDGAERRIPLGAGLLESQQQQVLDFDQDCPLGWRQHGGECLRVLPELRNRIVLVGRLADDPSPYAGRPGPEIVAWAVTDLLGSGHTADERSLLNSPLLHLSLALLTTGVALLLFIGLLRFIRRWRLNAWRIAAVAAGVALLLPLGLVGLARLLGHDFSQILLPVLSMLLTLALATHYQGRTALATEEARKALPDMDFAAYDVFVSYRHSHRDWVEGTIKPLLESIRRVDGSTLSLFLDSEGIHSGDNWASRLGRVIHESRVFLAVLTPDYFEPNANGRRVCEWEMEQALQRHAENAMTILPVFHAGYDPEQNTPATLPHLRPIQGPFSTAPDWAEKVRRRILDALDKER
ncbi:MAG: TIR domain-containing protein [Candidatus Accumulibacter sp.]|uniref:TIR domain-containing protein n=1 Tax=Candidatus Accumulibacter proximus TaxID=2954385 RepID=A0A935PVU8_9PROT|nr:TIR domain-containing protein [Candidatus Accumulibacter proximus]